MPADTSLRWLKLVSVLLTKFSHCPGTRPRSANVNSWPIQKELIRCKALNAIQPAKTFWNSNNPCSFKQRIHPTFNIQESKGSLNDNITFLPEHSAMLEYEKNRGFSIRIATNHNVRWIHCASSFPIVKLTDSYSLRGSNEKTVQCRHEIKRLMQLHVGKRTRNNKKLRTQI